MTRQEVLLYLHTLKWFLSDLGYDCVAGKYEDAEMKLYADRLNQAQCREYADMILRRGRRGRVTLILLPPVEARALVVLRWLLLASPSPS